MVGGAGATAAARTAAPASRMPAPQRSVVQSDVAGNGFAVATRIARTWSWVSQGATASISEIVPDTIGADTLVPPTFVMVSATGIVVPVLDRKTTESAGVRKFVEPPGADNVTPLPKLLNPASLPPTPVVDAMARNPGQLAGEL